MTHRPANRAVPKQSDGIIAYAYAEFLCYSTNYSRQIIVCNFVKSVPMP